MQSNLLYMALLAVVFAIILILIIRTVFSKNKSSANKCNDEKNERNKTGIHKMMLILSVIVTIFPILPLTILSTVSAVGSGASGEIISLWFLGGPIGFVALIRAFFNKVSKLDFWMLLYGGIAYVSLGLLTIANPYKEYESYSLLIVFLKIYISMSLIVFPWYLYICYKRCFQKSRLDGKLPI